MSDPVAVAAARWRAWMADAWPLWCGVGRDAPGLAQAGRGFLECLDLHGRPHDPGFKRLRVQARQIYCFAHAAVLGWPSGLDAAWDAWRFITAHASRHDGGWARTLRRDGAVLDATADLYDMGFVLLAAVWLARATGEAEPLQRAARTLDFILREMPAAGGEGFDNVSPVAPGHRQQNPHMHLLEALLALFELTGEARCGALSDALVELFGHRFVDPATGTLGEFFGPDWRPAPGEAGSHVEPGHHFEWVWLLHRHAGLRATPLHPAADALYRFAAGPGTDAATGLVRDVLDRAVLGRDGRARAGSSRLWPQTEAIKAHLVHGAPATAARLADTVLDRYLSQPPPGAWLDQFDAAGTPLSRLIPASSFYHVMVAYAELLRAAGPSDQRAA